MGRFKFNAPAHHTLEILGRVFHGGHVFEADLDDATVASLPRVEPTDEEVTSEGEPIQAQAPDHAPDQPAEGEQRQPTEVAQTDEQHPPTQAEGLPEQEPAKTELDPNTDQGAEQKASGPTGFSTGWPEGQTRGRADE